MTCAETQATPRRSTSRRRIWSTCAWVLADRSVSVKSDLRKKVVQSLDKVLDNCRSGHDPTETQHSCCVAVAADLLNKSRWTALATTSGYSAVHRLLASCEAFKLVISSVEDMAVLNAIRLQVEELENRTVPQAVVTAEPHRFTAMCPEIDNQKFKFLEAGTPVNRLILRAYPFGVNALDVADLGAVDCLPPGLPPPPPPPGLPLEEVFNGADIRIRVVRESNVFQPGGMQVVNTDTGQSFSHVTYLVIAKRERVGSQNIFDIATLYTDGSIRLAPLIDAPPVPPGDKRGFRGADFTDTVVVGPSRVLMEQTGEERPYANASTLMFNPLTLQFTFRYVDGGTASGTLTVAKNGYTQLALDLNYNKSNGIAWYESMNVGYDPTADVQMMARVDEAGRAQTDPIADFAGTGNDFLAYKDVRTSHNARGGNTSLTFGPDTPAWGTPVILEAEDGSGPGFSREPRDNASGHGNGHITRFYSDGQTLSMPFTVRQPGEYLASVRYSMDNPNVVNVTLKINGTPIGTFRAQPTGAGGAGWYVFRHSPSFSKTLSPGNYTLDVTVQDTTAPHWGIEFDTAALVSRVTPVAAPVTVQSAAANSGAAQRSMVTSLVVAFSTVVTFATTPGSAFTLTRAGGGTVGFTATAATVGGTTVVTLNGFSGNEAISGSLKDGKYLLTALASQITAGGAQLDGDGNGTAGDNYTFNDAQGLFRLYGDGNGDRFVNGADFALFRAAFGTSAGDPNYNAAFDLNGDGFVNGADFAAFRANFGQSI